MQLRVTNINGQIGIKTTDAVLSIRQPKGELEMTTKKTDLNLKINLPKVKIDQSQCFSEAGLKDVFELTAEAAQRGMQNAQETIGKIAADGDRMANFQTKEDVIAALDWEKAFPGPVDYNIGFIPRSRPKIEVEGGVAFNPQLGGVEFKAKIYAPEITVATKPSVEIFLMRKPEFHFEFIGNNVDIQV